MAIDRISSIFSIPPTCTRTKLYSIDTITVAEKSHHINTIIIRHLITVSDTTWTTILWRHSISSFDLLITRPEGQCIHKLIGIDAYFVNVIIVVSRN